MRSVKVTQGRAEALVTTDDRINFSDVIGEALGIASVEITNVVREYDDSYTVMYDVGHGPQAFFCTMKVLPEEERS